MNKRTPPASVLVVLALAAALAALAGCTCCPKGLTPQNVEPVNILVTWNAATSAIYVFPHRAHLCEERQYPVWVLAGAPEGSRLGIEFRHGSPFDSAPASPPKPSANLPAAAADRDARSDASGVVRMGVPRAGTAGKSYKYDVRLTLPDGKVVTLDPDVDIWR